MSETTKGHTPGPWTMAHHEGLPYADVTGPPRGKAIAHDMLPADARLIAAAPEMLEVLRDMADTLQWLQDSGNLKSPIEPHPYGLGIMAVKQKARAAIRKATGEGDGE